MTLAKAARKISAAARHVLRKILTKVHKKPNSQEEVPSLSLSSPMASHVSPNPFPTSLSSVLPQPSPFLSPHLLSSPLPTSSFFQNFTLKNGDQPEYIHPYLIKLSLSSLSLSYPSRFLSPLFIYQAFSPDLTISGGGAARHVISSFDDLSLTLDFPPSLRFHLIRGSPYVTCSISSPTSISLSSCHAVISLSSNLAHTKHTISLNNGYTFLCYSSSPLFLSLNSTLSLSSEPFSGIIRIAHLPNPNSEPILDQFSTCYPVSAKTLIPSPFSLEYKFQTKGWGELLLLAHPLHVKLLERETYLSRSRLVPELRYRSIDGDLIGVVSDQWVLNTSPLPVTFHSLSGVRELGFPEIAAALQKDVSALAAITTTSSYFFGKALCRTARLALIAEEIGLYDVIPKVRDFLEREMTPWMDGTSKDNGFVYENLWGGIITKDGLKDAGADFGFGVYNDHHYHLGYFVYAMAVLSKLDPSWGMKYMHHGYAMVGDYMGFSSEKLKSYRYPRLRCFDLWKLHSWASGLTEFADGRNQESTSEAINGYYSAALLGMSYGDAELTTMAQTLMAFEVEAAKTWWHVKEEDGIYEGDFCRENRLVGVLWANKRDSGLWFGPPEWKECRVGIQVLPLLPVTEVVFGDLGFVRELVKWVYPALGREGVGEGWKGFVYALEGLYDVEGALEKTRRLREFDDGNSLSNMLWWLYSRRVCW